MKLIRHSIGKISLMTLLLHIMLITQITLVHASPDVTVRVEPYASTATVGTTFTVNLTLTGVQNLYGLETTLKWNTSVIRIIGVNIRLGVESKSDGILHEPIRIYQNETLLNQGEYLLAASSTAPAASFSGNGNILIATFNVTNTGNTQLALETKLADKPPTGSVASPIAHADISGIFSPILISISPATIVIGEATEVNGQVAVSAVVDVTLQYRATDESNWLSLPKSVTDANGNYHSTWQPTQIGTYEIRATAIVEGGSAISYPVHLTVKAQEQQNSFWQYVIIGVAVVVIAGLIAILVYRRRKT